MIGVARDAAGTSPRTPVASGLGDERITLGRIAPPKWDGGRRLRSLPGQQSIRAKAAGNTTRSPQALIQEG